MRPKSGSVMKNLIILDFDGTIVNTVPLVTEILNCLRSRLGLPLLTLSDVRPWISKGGIPMISNCLSVSEITFPIFTCKKADDSRRDRNFN